MAYRIADGRVKTNFPAVVLTQGRKGAVNMGHAEHTHTWLFAGSADAV